MLSLEIFVRNLSRQDRFFAHLPVRGGPQTIPERIVRLVIIDETAAFRAAGQIH